LFRQAYNPLHLVLTLQKDYQHDPSYGERTSYNKKANEFEHDKKIALPATLFHDQSQQIGKNSEFTGRNVV
jgi:hypothetical protein